MAPNMVSAATLAAAAGLSVIPIMPGSKKPAWDVLPRIPNAETQELEPKWEPFKARIAAEDEIKKMFGRGQWLAVICGAISQNLELMDFDIPGKGSLKEGEKGTAPAWLPFKQLVKFHEREDLFRRLVIIETKSGGRHLLYRCETPPEGNQKLAETIIADKREALVETRGEGGYFVTFPSPGYEIKQGSLDQIPLITAEEREFLLRAGRALNEIEDEPEVPRAYSQPTIQRPGDDFNQKADWSDILLKHNWVLAGKTTGNRKTWVRPGKAKKDGISATTGTGPDLMVVFSANAAPFEPRAYTKFQAYTLLECGGDFHFAAQTLKTMGYGARTVPATSRIVQVPHAKLNAPDELDELEVFGDDFAPVEPEFYWDPYLPKGKCVLLDADGGTGKSSLAIGVAAMFSQGIIPITGETCEPLKTLYLHKGEDQSNELETVYRACGGADKMIAYYKKADLFFDPEGLDRIHTWITKGKFSLVVVDAFFYFLPSRVEDTSDNLVAQAVVQAVNEVAADTRTTFLNQRHTTKGSVGKSAEHLGMGSVAFRNSHRGQLVARWHPDQRGVVIVEDKKGSILIEKGEHFAYRRVGKSIEFIRNIRNPFDDARETPRTPREAAHEFIKGFAADWVYVSALDGQAEARGLSVRGALERAKSEMVKAGQLEYRITSPGGPRMIRFVGGPN